MSADVKFVDGNKKIPDDRKGKDEFEKQSLGIVDVVCLQRKHGVCGSRFFCRSESED